MTNMTLMYNQMFDTQIPSDYTSFEGVLSTHYRAFVTFYQIIKNMKTKKIKKISYCEFDNTTLILEIEIKEGKVLKFIEDFYELSHNIDSDKFNITLSKISETKVNVNIISLEEDELYYENRFSELIRDNKGK